MRRPKNTKPLPELTCKCGRPIVAIATAKQLSRGGRDLISTYHVCFECKKFFTDKEVREAKIQITLSVSEYRRVQDHLLRFKNVAIKVLGRQNQLVIENTVMESEELRELLSNKMEII